MPSPFPKNNFPIAKQEGQSLLIIYSNENLKGKREGDILIANQLVGKSNI